MDLAPLQARLEQIYGFELGHQVEDFLVTDPTIAAELDTSASARVCPEKLLVAEDEDALAVSLFIDEAVMTRLRLDNPCDRLHEHNLNDFCTALEGVSHFIYLVHRADRSRQVTLLELELQAEVDKYVTALTLFEAQGLSAVPRAFLRRLFEDVRFAPDLDDDEHARYASANSLAGRYCGHLEARFLGSRSPAAYFGELRTFWLMNQPEKLRRIASAQH